MPATESYDDFRAIAPAHAQDGAGLFAEVRGRDFDGVRPIDWFIETRPDDDDPDEKHRRFVAARAIYYYNAWRVSIGAEPATLDDIIGGVGPAILDEALLALLSWMVPVASLPLDGETAATLEGFLGLHYAQIVAADYLERRGLVDRNLNDPDTKAREQHLREALARATA